MKLKITPFVDHEIGYKLLIQLISYAYIYNYEITAVITTSNNGTSWWPGVNEICQRENIKLYIYEEIEIEKLIALKPDWFLLLSWKYLIPNALIKAPIKGFLNLHYSLLPAFRGVYPVNWSIISGEKKTGFTYHFVNEKIDSGEIFMQVEVPIRLSDTSRTLQVRIDNAVCNHFNQFLALLMKFKNKEESRNDSANSIKNNYYSKNKFNEICALDLDVSYSASEFLNLLRGLTFTPQCQNAYFYDKSSGKKIYISINLWEEKS